MSALPPIEIEHLPPRLHQDFDGLITPITAADPTEVETNFCSRALAAFAVCKLARTTLQEAADALVDGGGDGGIDAVYFAASSNTLWCIQSKFTRDGLSEPALTEVSKFADGLEALLRGEFGTFRSNPSWRAKLQQIEHILNSGSPLVRAALVYSGIRLVSDDRRMLFRRLEHEFSHGDDFFKTFTYNLTSIHDWLVDSEGRRVVDEVKLCIRKPGWVRNPFEMVYGLVPLADIYALSAQHGDQIVASNIRRYKGDTEVNQMIASTVREAPADFVYVNNGITAYCQRLEVRPIDRANAEEKNVTAYGFSIVNGAQTVGALLEACSQGPAPEGYVLMRLVSLERCEDERSFAEKLTRCTNTQNEILARDYIALEPEQERIANQLAPSSVDYHYRLSDETIPQDDSNFSILEATTAAACLIQEQSGELCSRILANRKSLWDTEIEEGQTISRYKLVFSDTLSARCLWRSVQSQRIIIEKLRELARAEPVRRPFFENGRWLVLHLLFLELSPEDAGALLLTPAEKQAMANKTLEIVEELWEAALRLGHVSNGANGGFEYPRNLRSVFCDKEDCRRIRAEVLRARAAHRGTRVS